MQNSLEKCQNLLCYIVGYQLLFIQKIKVWTTSFASDIIFQNECEKEKRTDNE